jgi:hypothetical protein
MITAHFDSPYPLEHLALAQGIDKKRPGEHRSDGMGTGRPDADFEKVEYADRHAKRSTGSPEDRRHHGGFANTSKSGTDVVMPNPVRLPSL